MLLLLIGLLRDLLGGLLLLRLRLRGWLRLLLLILLKVSRSRLGLSIVVVTAADQCQRRRADSGNCSSTQETAPRQLEL